MKILQIIDIPWHSGVTNYAIEISKGLSRKGHKIYFAGVKEGLPLKLAKENGYETIEICSRRNPFILNSVFRLKKLIEKEKIEIVNAHTGKGHFLAYITQLFLNKKFTIIRTKSDTLYPRKSFIYKKTAKIIAASEFIRKRYLDIGIEPSKVVTIYQGLKISPRSEVRSPKSEIPTVGMVGRLDPVKGHRYFLEAAVNVLKKYPSARFLIAGKEENIKYKELGLLVGKLGIKGAVEFKGYIDNVYEFMSKCSIGVVASVGSEAVSRVLFEWMVCRKPVVATSVGCIPEILPQKYLVQVANPDLLAEKICGLLADGHEMEKYAALNRTIIEEKFNFDDFVLKTEKVCKEVVN
ncbi:MAG: glycosyltransferase [Elusimicrobia bacterium]|nr:glycosyltransferase [Elusimicrobiota bacterium]